MFRLILLSLFVSSLAQAQLTTVPHVDVAQYLGRWYQILRNPQPFEPANCPCAQQTLSLREDGLVGVYNSCNVGSVTGQLTEIRGTARNLEPSSNAKFEVDFGLPQLGQYWIIGLGPQYQFAVVSDPSLRSLYLLSKTPTLTPELEAEALALAAAQVDTSKLRRTEHAGCQYPQ